MASALAREVRTAVTCPAAGSTAGAMGWRPIAAMAVILAVSGCSQLAGALPAPSGGGFVVVRVTGDDGTPISRAAVELACRVSEDAPDPAAAPVDMPGLTSDVVGSGMVWTDETGAATVGPGPVGQPCTLRVRPTAGDWRPAFLSVGALGPGVSHTDVTVASR